MIKVKARSYTTGQIKWFELTKEAYKKRFDNIPAWDFDSRTIIEI